VGFQFQEFGGWEFGDSGFWSLALLISGLGEGAFEGAGVFLRESRILGLGNWVWGLKGLGFGVRVQGSEIRV